MSNINSSCPELNNIQYRNMLLNGGGKLNSVPSNNDISSIEDILEKESDNHKNETWNKLDKTQKLTKLHNYITSLITTHKLTKSETQQLRKCLHIGLERSRLLHVKDVTYNTKKGVIENIPCLYFENTTRKFTLKRNEKRSSTLKSLAPGKTRKKLEKIDGDIKDN